MAFLNALSDTYDSSSGTMIFNSFQQRPHQIILSREKELLTTSCSALH